MSNVRSNSTFIKRINFPENADESLIKNGLEIKDDSRKALNTHRNHKDRIFCDLFSAKENALSLINALSGIKCTDPNELEIMTLSDVLYITKKNDFAVCIRGALSLVEQNSTINPNMPLRGLIYFGQEYDKWVTMHNLNSKIYSSKLVKIPQPLYYVLYNGMADAPAYEEQRLSNAFINPSRGYEWTAHVYNIRSGKNDELLDKCPALKGYSTFVENIYINQEAGLSLDESVSKSADYCIKHGFISDYLTERKGELMQMTLGEISLEDMKEVWYEEGVEDGIERERNEKVRRFLIMYNNDIENASKLFDIPIDKVKEIADTMK